MTLDLATLLLLLLNVFLLVAFGGLIGWLAHEVWNTKPKE